MDSKLLLQLIIQKPLGHGDELIKHVIIEGYDIEPKYKQVLDFVTSELIMCF